MTPSPYSLLFLGKAEDPYCARALEFCQDSFSPVAFCLGKWGDPLSQVIQSWEGDYIVSYLSRWVIPDAMLKRARTAAINFHPASPEYPGIGCNNFALYEDAKEYGVTCHHMAPKVDTGRIIAVRRFPVYPDDDVAALLSRTYENQIALFFEIAHMMAEGKELPASDETWTRPPFTRKQFNELFRITPDMSKDEIARRVRAVSYGPFQPHVEIEGYRFEYKPLKE
ncbi:MAG TPA: formyltransferase family protein [Anaerolineales bacterium]|nr:formyltransferase family protein [Anaerolineales bacterium]